MKRAQHHTDIYGAGAGAAAAAFSRHSEDTTTANPAVLNLYQEYCRWLNRTLENNVMRGFCSTRGQLI